MAKGLAGWASSHRIAEPRKRRPNRGGTRTAGFAIAAVIARPIGGILSDLIGASVVVMISLADAAVLAILITLQPGARLGHRGRPVLPCRRGIGSINSAFMGR